MTYILSEIYIYLLPDRSAQEVIFLFLSTCYLSVLFLLHFALPKLLLFLFNSRQYSTGTCDRGAGVRVVWVLLWVSMTKVGRVHRE